ncbi:hypothetical protein HYFRA_00011678 [Hymenoscyphus fraxineus]|uniref:Smr domain-containing protein n=1 Tax=Hymenoscyphus fraxineus TaxID=746836 RepID=A0A9N9KYG6_9HELO|nr:hypothetical protein HYFRA_00011678 [Hymenoscyphus fraxineus]
MSSHVAMGDMTSPRAFNHSQSEATEREYDRLRDLARAEANKKNWEAMKAYNKQASDFIFRENNANGRVPDDTIDLHGQFVKEAEQIVRQRIVYAKGQGQGHLHVIVGKGNHSVNHVQKIKPAVEEVCREEGLQFATEANAGVIYINLQGGEAIMPPNVGQQHGNQGQHHGGQQHHGGHQQGGYPGAPQHGQQQQGGDDDMEKLAKKLLPKVLKKLEGCCVVM